MTVNPIWTHELATSARIIAAERQPQPEREQLAGDIRIRAGELVRHCQIGTPLTAVGVGIVQQFRSRLADSFVSFVGADPFERAWAEAWAAAEESSAAA